MQVIITGCGTNLSIAAGETVAGALAIASGGNPVDLAGYVLKMQVDFPTPLALNIANGGITITDAATGTAQINIADTTSTAFAPGSYPYDLWMISGGGAATRLLHGSFTVYQAVAVIP
jgi:hypothetical protein